MPKLFAGCFDAHTTIQRIRIAGEPSKSPTGYSAPSQASPSHISRPSLVRIITSATDVRLPTRHQAGVAKADERGC